MCMCEVKGGQEPARAVGQVFVAFRGSGVDPLPQGSRLAPGGHGMAACLQLFLVLRGQAGADPLGCGQNAAEDSDPAGVAAL